MAAVKTLALGDVVLPKDTTRVYTGSASAATIPVVAKDQYGNDLDKANKLTGVTVLSSDSAVIPTIIDVDNKPVINLNTTSLTTAKSVTLTLVINATGETVTKTIDIVKPAQADVVTLGNLETNVVAATDAANKFVLPITVVNQFGETLTAKQIASAGLSITGTGAFASSALAIETDATSANYGKIVNTSSIGSAGVGTIVVTSPTGKTVSANYDVKAARKVVELAAPKTVKTNLVSGASTAVAYQFKDQYGDFVAATENPDLKWKVSVTDLTGDAGVVSADKTTGTNESLLNPVTVTAAAGKAGTAKVTTQLLNSSDEVLSQIDNTFTVVANNAEGLTYAIGDVPTLFSHATTDTDVDGTNAYAQALTFSAKDAKGNEYAIPSSQILSVESVNGYFQAARVGEADLDAQDESIVIGAKDATEIGSKFGTGTTVTDTIKVTFNTASGVKVINKEVTISKEAKKATEIKVVDKDLNSADPYEFATGTKEVSSFTFADRAAAGTGTNAFVLVKDQYGVWTKKSFEADALILNTVGSAQANIDADNGFEFTGGKFILDGTIAYKGDTTLRYSFIDGNQTASVTVKVTAEEAPTVVTKLAASGTNTTTSLVFSEAIDAASRKAVKEVVDASYTKTGNATVVSVWDVDNKTLNVTVTPGTGTVTHTALSVPASFKVKDLVGNESAALTVGTLQN